MSEHVLATRPDPAVVRVVALLDRLLPSQRDFAVRLWEGTELPATVEPKFTVVLNHPGALRRMLTPPVELSVGEAFVYGDFDIEGDIFSAFGALHDLRAGALSISELASVVADILSLPVSASTRQAGRGRAQLSGAVHSRERDRAAIQYHYDVGNDFYALWLDRNMQYSCAYFATGTEDLDNAQERKLEHICRKLRLQPGERLLDIGCGWGGLACYAASSRQVQVTGVTLSSNQVEYAGAQIARKVWATE